MLAIKLMFSEKINVHLLVIYQLFLHHFYPGHTHEFLVWKLYKPHSSLKVALGHGKLKNFFLL